MGSLDVEPPGAEKPPIGVFPAQVVAAGIEQAAVTAEISAMKLSQSGIDRGP
jgi:hypothetical protein